MADIKTHLTCAKSHIVILHSISPICQVIEYNVSIAIFNIPQDFPNVLVPKNRLNLMIQILQVDNTIKTPYTDPINF